MRKGTVIDVVAPNPSEFRALKRLLFGCNAVEDTGDGWRVLRPDRLRSILATCPEAKVAVVK